MSWEFQLADTASNSTNKAARIRNRHTQIQRICRLSATSTSSTNVVQFEEALAQKMQLQIVDSILLQIIRRLLAQKECE